MVRLHPHDYEPFLSPYLMGGWRQDELVLDELHVEPGLIRGVVHVASCFWPGDGQFHLTVPVAFIWIAQLAIIYGCWERKLPKKAVEIYVREIQLKCKRPVRSVDAIELVLTLASRRLISEGVFYSGDISIDGDAFVGTASFVLPLAEQQGEMT
ncbi:MAG: hypothetical protein AB7O59_19940 [Pirellulales bacterium]